MFYTRGFSAMFYTTGVWVGRARSGPVRGRHGMPTLKPSKANKAIFRAVVERYIFLSGVTWLKI
jgi:hypothetical protein